MTELDRQHRSADTKLEIFLVDDGSRDGTGEAVTEAFPDVRVIRGDGSLYWCGGMRLAWDEASKTPHDYYLWLNDDTLLFPDALESLLDAAKSVAHDVNDAVIVVGSTKDAQSGAFTYGGCVQRRPKSLDFVPVIPSGMVEPCDTFNGNCVLVSQQAFARLGNLSRDFTHAMGDTDYGLRAKEANIGMWVAAEYVGYCSKNPPPAWLDTKRSLAERIAILKSPKGLPPKEWATFCKRHLDLFWAVSVFKVFIRVVFPNGWERIKPVLRLK